MSLLRYWIQFWACLMLALSPTVAAVEIESAVASAVSIFADREGARARGSGFVVVVGNGAAVVVTASHVIEGARVEVVFAASATERFEVDGTDILGMEGGNPNGLAVFVVRGALPDGVTALSFDVETALQWNEDLLLIGFPQGARTPLTLSRRYAGRRSNLLVLDLPVGSGFSGGPVLWGDNAVGVVTGEDAGLTFAVPAQVAHGFVTGSGIAIDGRAFAAASSPAPSGPEPAASRGIGAGTDAADTLAPASSVAIVEPRRAVGSSAAVTLADKLLKAGLKAATVAVADFTDLRGKVNPLGRYLAEELSVALAGASRDHAVIDRSHLVAILRERKLSETDFIEPSAARELVKIAGIKTLITGSVTPLDNSVRLVIKILDAETGSITGWVRDNLARAGEIAYMLRFLAQQTLEKNKFSFALRGCTATGGKATCDLIVTNQSRDRTLHLYGTSRIFDEFGNEYSAGEAKLGIVERDISDSHIANELIRNVPTKARVTFPWIAEESRLLRALEINCRSFKVQFFDVPLTR